MKILIVSDTHRKVIPLINLIADINPEAVIHLGDLFSDAEKANEVYPNIPFYFVAGNNDFSFIVPSERLITLSSKKILITHGHNYDVKNRISLLKKIAKSKNADIVMFGHTHKPLYEKDGELHILNPGAIFRPLIGRATYAIADINTEIKIEINYL